MSEATIIKPDLNFVNEIIKSLAAYSELSPTGATPVSAPPTSAAPTASEPESPQS